MMTTQIEDETTQSAVMGLLRDLQSGNEERASTAQGALNRIGPSAIGPLLAVLELERGRRKRNRPVIQGLFAALAALHLLLWLTWTSSAVWIIIPIQAVLVVQIVRLFASTRLQNGATRALSLIHDVHAIGPLAEALEFKDLYSNSGTASVAEEALIRLLPGIEAGDADLLNSAQRACLRRVLQRQRYPVYKELTISILQALTRIGDDEAIPIIQRLASQEPRTEPESVIQRVASECLPVLLAHKQNQTDLQLLLRAAASNAPQSLLRAVTEHKAPETDLLLRPETGRHDLSSE